MRPPPPVTNTHSLTRTECNGVVAFVRGGGGGVLTTTASSQGPWAQSWLKVDSEP
jgi:hypothetical protein